MPSNTAKKTDTHSHTVHTRAQAYAQMYHACVCTYYTFNIYTYTVESYTRTHAHTHVKKTKAYNTQYRSSLRLSRILN